MLCGKNLTRWLWPWKSIGFQIILWTKYVPSLVKIQWRMLILECSQGCYRRTDGSITISLRNFVGEGIINHSLTYSNIISLCEKLLNAYFLIQSVMTWKKCNAQIMCTSQQFQKVFLSWFTSFKIILSLWNARFVLSVSFWQPRNLSHIG